MRPAASGAEAAAGPTTRRSGRFGPWLLLTAFALCTACSDAPPVHRGPIVLITIDALRADLIGQGLMPHIDRLAAEADWAGAGIATSSWTVPSMASLFTGRQPWRHGSWHGSRGNLNPDLATLPEILRERGFENSAFRSNSWLTESFGYVRGFDRFSGSTGRMERVREILAALDGGPQFVWVHLLPPHAPYRLHASYLDRLGAPRDDLPERITPLEMRPFVDPEAPLDPGQRERAWQLYQLTAAHADSLVGQMLETLRESGRYDEALIALTSDHGEEFGENDQALHGNNLHRVLIEVPLIVKLPGGWPRTIDPGPTVGNHRLFSTLIEAAGGDPPPGSPPSLFERSADGVLSELYVGNGVNRFSLVEGDRQLVWTSRFATSEEQYYDAMMALGEVDPPLSPGDEPPEAMIERLERKFEAAPPLMGATGAQPDLQAFRWTAGGGVEPVEATDDFARRLQDLWQRENGPDRAVTLAERGDREISPEEMEKLRALGYVVTPRRKDASP